MLTLQLYCNYGQRMYKGYSTMVDILKNNFVKNNRNNNNFLLVGVQTKVDIEVFLIFKIQNSSYVNDQEVAVVRKSV